MLNKDRPLSPHLTIYKPQITTVLSIMHRITGVSLFFGLIIILWAINICSFKASNVAGLRNILSYINANQFFFSVCVLWSYCIFYHLCAGIRYLFWDAGIGMEIKVVNITGWITIFCSIILTYIFWHIIIF
jgi:succinate dehydrogenase / fumarate reductase cytochrome b subunit